MRITTRQAVGFALVLIGIVGLAGCYRPAGDDLAPTPPEQNVSVTQLAMPPSFTPPVEQTGSPEGGFAPGLDTPTSVMAPPPTGETITDAAPLLTPTNTIVPLPTIGPPTTMAPLVTEGAPDMHPDAGVGGGPTATFTVAAVVIAPTQTPTWTVAPPLTLTPTGTATETPTSTPSVTPSVTPSPTSSPSLAPTLPPTTSPTPSITPPPSFTPPPVVAFGPTATFTVIPFNTLPPSATPTIYVPPPSEALPLAERPSEAAPATFTPAVVAQGPTLSPNQATATALVTTATAAAAATLGIAPPPAALPTATPQGFQPVQTLPPITGATPTTAPLGPGQKCYDYLIAPGDTLSRIAVRYGVKTQDIAQMNNIVNPDLIKAGDTISIPCPVPATPTPVVSEGQGGGPTEPRTGPTVHIVVEGDNVYRLSLRYGVTMTDIMQANGMTPATINQIYVGQELIIPASTATTTIPFTPTPTLSSIG